MYGPSVSTSGLFLRRGRCFWFRFHCLAGLSSVGRSFFLTGCGVIKLLFSYVGHGSTPFLAACCCGPLHSFWSGLLLRLRLRNLRRNFLRAAGRIRPFRFAFSRFSATSLACLNVGPFFAKPFAKSAFTLFCYCHVSQPYCCRLTNHRLWICTIWTPKRLRTQRGRP